MPVEPLPLSGAGKFFCLPIEVAAVVRWVVHADGGIGTSNIIT